MRIPALVTALALATLVPSALSAHVQLTASTPAAGSAAKAVKTVTLTFSEPVDQASAAVRLVMTAMPGMKDHGEMLMRNFTVSWSKDGRSMILTLRNALPAGTYDVRWQAAAADGHAMSGKVTFTVS